MANLIELENRRNNLAIRRSEKDVELAALDHRIADVEDQLRAIATGYERALSAQIISLDDGLTGRIREAIENKHIAIRERLSHRSYRGTTEDDPDWKHVGEVHVFEDEMRVRLLPTMTEHVNHSPDGFAWGYGGSGPAQLVFALLFDVTSDLDKTQRYYQEYKWDVVANLPREAWTVTADSIIEWLFKAESRTRKAEQKA